MLLNVLKFAATVIDADPSKVTLLIVTGFVNLSADGAVPAGIVIDAEPSNVTLLIVTGITNLVAVSAVFADAALPVLLNASVIPYPAIVVGILFKLLNAVVTEISVVPSNATPLIFLAFTNLIA